MTHIVIAADAGYLEHAACMLRQVSIHARGADGLVLLVPPDVTEGDLAPTRAIAARYGVALDVVPLPEYADLLASKSIAERDHVSAFTYSKLFMADALPHLDDVLYLDIDTLVRDDITALLAWPLIHPIGAVHELGSNGVMLFGSTRVSYFNAGVLRMSLARLREMDVLATALEIIRANPRLPFQEQDVLNMIFRDDHDVLPLAYNVFDSLAAEALPSWKMLRDPAIVHFVGPTKPWHSASSSRFAQEWRSAQADALRLPAGLVSAYVHGDPDDRRTRLAVTLARVRQSPAGRRMRAALPLEVKHAFNMAALKVLPPRSRLGQEYRTVIWSEESPMTTDPSRSGAVDSPATESATGRSEAAAALPARALPMPRTGRLVLVLSLPRSGTTALNSTLHRGVPDLHVEGEFYYGLVHRRTIDEVHDAFPWIGDRADEYERTGIDDPSTPQWRAYRETMNAHAVEVTRTLLDRRTGPTMIKVFAHHLDPATLDEVVGTFHPEVIVVRRRLLFSYVSHVKATRTNAWNGKDNTDAGLEAADADARRYIDDADEWIRHVNGLCARHGIDAQRVTYEGLFESLGDRAAVAAALARAGAVMGLDDPASWQPATRTQDRRTDESLEGTFALFDSLSADVRRDLLRYPG